MTRIWRTLAALPLVVGAGAAAAATLVASYGFNDTLASDGNGAPALVAIDPLAANRFEDAVVDGATRRVYHWDGTAASPATHAGLMLDATGLVAYDNYSVELTFEFLESAQAGSGWRRIMDTQNRQSDIGFYVEPSDRLQVYDVVTGSTVFTTPGFHTVVLTNFVVGGTREVKAYLDGRLELTSGTDQINLDNANNPGHLLYFFVDNLAGPAQQEFADGRIASLKLYDGILTPVPEPAPAALMLAGIAVLGWRLRRRRAG